MQGHGAFDVFCVSVNGSHIEPVNCDTPGAYLVMTHAEFIQSSPFYLDLESAAQISGALLMAMAVVAAGPMLVVFPFFQKYFISGLTVGAVKG